MLDVWADQQLAGKLAHTQGRVEHYRFGYDLNASETQAVSLTMPLDLLGYEYPQGLHPIFQMNLPEGRLREVLDRQFRKIIPSFDDLALLEVVGPSQIGRLRYGLYPQANVLPQHQSVQEILTYDGAEDLFVDLLHRFANLSGVSGVQPKVLIRDEQNWTLSGDGRRSLTVRGATHIVKSWDQTEYPELAANEFFCMEVARKSGLATPEYSLSDNGKFLVVERFDLDAEGQYLGFEDGCVLHGLPTRAKYEGSYEALAKTIRLFCSPSLRIHALQQFFRMLAVSCAVRNGDAHLKNFGVLYAAPGGTVDLAPAYDIVCTSAYLPNDVMALTLDGRKSYPSRKVLIRFAQQHCGLSAQEGEQVLLQIADSMTEIRQMMRLYVADHSSFQMIAGRIDKAWQQGMQRSLLP